MLDGTAAPHSIPLILCNHGGGDDPVQAVDELGLITLAGKERIALVAPRYATDMTGGSVMSASPFDVNGQSLPALVEYMLENLPRPGSFPRLCHGLLHGWRGYSGSGRMGAAALCRRRAMAAGTPWGIYAPTDEQAAQFDTYNVADDVHDLRV